MISKHGLVIGKFYPPHAGHKLLVQTAARRCERVTVVVMAASRESLPLADRVAWMREIHADDPGVTVTGIVDDVAVDYDDPAIWHQHVALMRQALQAIDAPPVDAVFTSEPYGEELARRFGARAVTLDVSRVLAPISATRVRDDVPGNWAFLDPPVRAALALRVVVVGAESTGTTTLSRALADHYRARWVPEYGREYSVLKFSDAVAAAQLEQRAVPGFEDIVWTSPEFAHIARKQVAAENAQARIGGPILVCDTDAFATGIWHERYLGTTDPEVEAIAARRPGDLYLVTHHEGVAFEQDGVRDGESIREWMTQRFIEKLGQAGLPFEVLRGTRAERLAEAIRAVDALRSRAWRFAAPLG
jgi:HTH-type transcriptional repressor of NAD biosynthesis genes